MATSSKPDPADRPTLHVPKPAVSTVGAKVLYQPPKQPGETALAEQPFTMWVAYAWPDGTVNLGGFDHNGTPTRAERVPFVAEADAPKHDGHFALRK